MLCCCSVTKSCPTLCDPMDCSTPGCPVLHYLPEFTEIYVHWVGDAIQPSHPLLPTSLLALDLSQNPLSMEFSRQNTGVGSHSLFQGIFLTRGSNLGLSHCRQILYCLSHQGSPIKIKQTPHSPSLPLLPYEDTERRPSINQEMGLTSHGNCCALF